MQHWRGTRRHIPRPAKTLWAKVLSDALSSCEQENTLNSWKELLMLPKAVLGNPPRTGTSARKCHVFHVITPTSLAKRGANEPMARWIDSPTPPAPNDGRVATPPLREANT